ncbi:hypothetical protein ACHRVW_10005 [Flavobacterium collinsii]|uniref:hypothetical protein n=1 Tax=Flavobacterium collinsii TaxID=1114861 RepID=UPI003756A129
MKLTEEKIRQVVGFYQERVPDYNVSFRMDTRIVDSIVEDEYFGNNNSSTLEQNLQVIFTKGKESLYLEEAIKRLDVPELEKVLFLLNI